MRAEPVERSDQLRSQRTIWLAVLLPSSSRNARSAVPPSGRSLAGWRLVGLSAMRHVIGEKSRFSNERTSSHQEERSHPCTWPPAKRLGFGRHCASSLQPRFL
jgi:hypothetical protein